MPAKAPEMVKARMMFFFSLMPAYLAASLFKPQALISNPKVVFSKITQMIMEKVTARTKPMVKLGSMASIPQVGRTEPGLTFDTLTVEQLETKRSVFDEQIM